MYKWQLRRRKNCLTQEELVKAYEGPDFDLADRYGEVSPTHTHKHSVTQIGVAAHQCVAWHSPYAHASSSKPIDCQLGGALMLVAATNCAFSCTTGTHHDPSCMIGSNPVTDWPACVVLL